MKNLILLILMAFAFLPASPQVSHTCRSEWLLSYSNTDGMANYLVGEGSFREVPRFTILPNVEWDINYDFGEHFGMFSGLGFYNVGFLLRDDDTKYVWRSINVGVPLAFRIGNMEKNQYMFIGAEMEQSIHLKRKSICGKERIRHGEYFSNKINGLMPSMFIGINNDDFYMQLKVYLFDFVNKTYKFEDEMPFLDVNSGIFSFTFGYNYNRK